MIVVMSFDCVIGSHSFHSLTLIQSRRGGQFTLSRLSSNGGRQTLYCRGLWYRGTDGRGKGALYRTRLEAQLGGHGARALWQCGMCVYCLYIVVIKVMHVPIRNTHIIYSQQQMRWVDEYFPFTDPSFELEIFFEDEWMEVLGCGVVRQEIIDNAGQSPHKGWAFGLGLERLAMVLFGIPDIRLFWTQDERFHSQFRNSSDKIVKFVPYSKYPPCYKDISFWTPNDGFHEHDVHELVRTVAGDLVEKVELIDSFVHPKTQRLSNCFRISYRSMDRSLTNEEVDAMQEQVRSLAVDELNVELR